MGKRANVISDPCTKADTLSHVDCRTTYGDYGGEYRRCGCPCHWLAGRAGRGVGDAFMTGRFLSEHPAHIDAGAVEEYGFLQVVQWRRQQAIRGYRRARPGKGGARRVRV